MNARKTGILVPIGQLFYGIAAVAYGIELIIYANLPGSIVPIWFPKLPGAPLSQFIAGLAMILCGAAIILKIRPRACATALGALLLFWVVFRDLYLIFAVPSLTSSQNSTCEAFAVCAGALIVARSLPSEHQSFAGVPAQALLKLEAILPLGRYFLGVALMFFGYVHIRYAQGVATLVPAWMPWHLFWAYFCGFAHLSAGIGILSGIAARLAAILAGIMISLFGVLLNIPLAVAAIRNPDLWTSTFDVLAWAGACFVLAGNFRPLVISLEAPSSRRSPFVN